MGGGDYNFMTIATSERQFNEFVGKVVVTDLMVDTIVGASSSDGGADIDMVIEAHVLNIRPISSAAIRLHMEVPCQVANWPR